MLMPDKLQQAEQQLAALQNGIAAEDYNSAVGQLDQLQQNLQQLFAQKDTINQQDYPRLQALTDNFFALISTLSTRQQQIKDSISQIAAVKSANKVSKTYKID